jgi:tRNA pseudouridine32 synthase / 23S rRNA pseudouridine746 synthase
VFYSIIDHNEDFVIVNKSIGITIQRDGDESGLLELVAADLGLPKLFPVHRLDKETSGLVVMAVHRSSNQRLSKLFADHLVQKFYIAISEQKPRKKQGLVIGDMEKARRGSWKLVKTRRNPAITQLFSTSMLPGKRLFLLRPKTGKTHQLRVALKSLAAPILGDRRYGPADAPSDRMYLHAWQLQFEWNGELRRYQCLPEQGQWYLCEQLKSALAPWQAPELLGWPEP